MNALDKKTLRREALARREAIDATTRSTFAERLALKGVDIARRAIARNVSAYWPMGAEADTRFLLEALVYHEFVACLPVVEARRRPLLFRAWTPKTPMIPAAFGTHEPSRHSKEVRPDVLFVPLAAFDRRGHRIGYGAGYYDLTLRALRDMKNVLAVGVAFAAQEIPEVPAQPHDERLDFVLTENDFIDCRVA